MTTEKTDRNPERAIIQPKVKHTDFIPPDERSTVEITRPSYQPSKADLEEDMRMMGTFDDLVQAVIRPVKIRFVRRPKDRS